MAAHSIEIKLTTFTKNHMDDIQNRSEDSPRLLYGDSTSTLHTSYLLNNGDWNHLGVELSTDGQIRFVLNGHSIILDIPTETDKEHFNTIASGYRTFIGGKFG